MRKFTFPLDTVLSYKQQILDSATGEYASAQALVREQEHRLQSVRAIYSDYNYEYHERQSIGMTAADALAGETALRALETRIRRESDQLQQCRMGAEEKRLAMVEAKKDTATLEKLRQKKMDSYQKDLQKGEEALIDELVSAAFAAQG